MHHHVIIFVDVAHMKLIGINKNELMHLIFARKPVAPNFKDIRDDFMFYFGNTLLMSNRVRNKKSM